MSTDGQGLKSKPTKDSKGNAWLAALYDWGQPRSEGAAGSRLRQAVLGGATGRVVEIGIGTGLSLAYYRHAEKIVGVEPDPAWMQRASKRAQQLGLDVEFHCGTAEALPLPDACFDTAVAIFVLCSVTDPRRALSEVRRVLKPGGTFRFIEHVRAEGGRAAQVQDWLTPLWVRIAQGCHLNRRTAEYLEAEGFEILELQKESPDGLSPTIFGVARPK